MKYILLIYLYDDDDDDDDDDDRYTYKHHRNYNTANITESVFFLAMFVPKYNLWFPFIFWNKAQVI